MPESRDPTIIVPTDFSKSSVVAMSLALTLSRVLHCPILLLHVFTYVPHHRYSVPVDWMVREIREQSKRQLARARLRILRASGRVETLLVNGPGDPGSEILQVAGKFDKPIIVLGTHSRTGIERFFLGSTAEQVLRHAECPVITVGPHVTPYWNRRILKMILATDLTERSLGPLPFLLSLWSPGSRLLILYVASPDAAITPTSWSDAIRSRLIETLGEAEVMKNVEFSLVVHTDPSKAIQEAASMEKADLLAIGVHPARAFTAYTSPKTSFQIVMSAPCPVLSVCE